MGKGIQVKGLDKLQKKLKESATLDEVKQKVQYHGAKLKNRMVKNADFTQGYKTGTTKRSIFCEIEDSGFTAAVGPGETPLNKKSGLPATEYSPYVEYGTRFMDAQPFVKPAFEEQKELFKRDLQKLMR